MQTARLPETTGLIPESFPLGREIAITCRNAKHEGIVILEDLWGDGREIGFGRSMHLAKNFFRKSLGDPGDRIDLAMVRGTQGKKYSAVVDCKGSYW